MDHQKPSQCLYSSVAQQQDLQAHEVPRNSWLKRREECIWGMWNDLFPVYRMSKAMPFAGLIGWPMYICTDSHKEVLHGLKHVEGSWSWYKVTTKKKQRGVWLHHNQKKVNSFLCAYQLMLFYISQTFIKKFGIRDMEKTRNVIIRIWPLPDTVKNMGSAYCFDKMNIWPTLQGLADMEWTPKNDGQTNGCSSKCKLINVS